MVLVFGYLWESNGWIVGYSNWLKLWDQLIWFDIINWYYWTWKWRNIWRVVYLLNSRDPRRLLKGLRLSVELVRGEKGWWKSIKLVWTWAYISNRYNWISKANILMSWKLNIFSFDASIHWLSFINFYISKWIIADSLSICINACWFQHIFLRVFVAESNFVWRLTGTNIHNVTGPM